MAMLKCCPAFIVALSAVIVGVWTMYDIPALVLYHPRMYGRYYRRMIAEGVDNVRQLNYTTRLGPQTAHYSIPSHVHTPEASDAAKGSAQRQHVENLWVMFGGNGQLGLDLVDVAMEFRKAHDPMASFLWIDYPGYGGMTSGSPSPDTIYDQAVGAVLAFLVLDDVGYLPRINVFGYSLGAAAALRFAAGDPFVNRVVCVAPFTSLVDVAETFVPRSAVTWMFRHHVWNNTASIERIAADSRGPPRLVVVHGAADRLIPFWMGQALVDQANENTRHRGLWASMIRVEEADHLWVIHDTGALIKAMAS